jgi:AraC-like DNA-binding protein
MKSAIQIEYGEFAPVASVAEWVRCYWFLRAPAGIIGEPQPILPDGCTEIVYDLADPFVRKMPDGALCTQHRTIVVGPVTRSVTVQPTGLVDLFGIRFHPWSAAVISRTPAREIRNLTPDASHVHSLLPDALREQLLDAQSMSERVRVVEHSLSVALRNAGSPPRSLQAALMELSGAREPGSMASLAKRVGTSQRTMQRQFDTMVGLSPKMFSRVMRMQRALTIRMRDDSRTWSAVAHMAGYYDHAHMVHDFVDLAGFPPSGFDSQEHSLTETFVS